jgi:hypothetical protein
MAAQSEHKGSTTERAGGAMRAHLAPVRLVTDGP